MTGPLHKPRLLCISHDPRLLETRVLLLARLYSATAVSNLPQIERLSIEKFDLALLCHSLPLEDAEEIAAAVRKHWPRAKLLAISRTGLECRPRGVDAVVDALDGPRALLRSVEATLQPLTHV